VTGGWSKGVSHIAACGPAVIHIKHLLHVQDTGLRHSRGLGSVLLHVIGLSARMCVRVAMGGYGSVADGHGEAARGSKVQAG